MATTVTTASLIVTINESYSLNGVDYGNNIVKTFTSNGEVVQRIMSIAEHESLHTAIFNYGAVDSAGVGVAADYVYFRVTNLDDTNFVTLRMHNGTDTCWIKVKAGESFMIMDNEIDAIGSSSTFGAFADITEFAALANTADVDIEFIAVTK